MSMTNNFQAGVKALTDAEKIMIAQREKLLGPAYKLFYQHPAQFVRGEGVWLYDVDENAYLDVYNNVPSVGHCHPHVVEAMARQAAQLNTHTRYLHNNVLDYAEHLLSTFPEPLSNVMFTCTGSEANDLAYRIAKLNTGGDGIIVTELAYHGGTDVIASMSPSLGKHVAIGKNVRLVPAPDNFRSDGNADTGKIFADNVRAAAQDLIQSGIQPAALLVDTIFSSDGVFADPAGFLSEAVDVIHEFGGLFIADEVQPGFGRLGESWWGFQRHNVMPDLVTLGKGMGAGHPLAGVVARPELLTELGKSRYFNTTGGTAVSCAVGKAVLEVIESESLIENAKQVGGYLRSALKGIATRHPVIGDVRGAGLFIGVEIVENLEALKPCEQTATRIVNDLREKRVLISSAGPHANVLKIRPPLPFNQDNAEHFLHCLEDVLKEL